MRAGLAETAPGRAQPSVAALPVGDAAGFVVPFAAKRAAGDVQFRQFPFLARSGRAFRECIQWLLHFANCQTTVDSDFPGQKRIAQRMVQRAGNHAPSTLQSAPRRELNAASRGAGLMPACPEARPVAGRESSRSAHSARDDCARTARLVRETPTTLASTPATARCLCAPAWRLLRWPRRNPPSCPSRVH